MGNFEPINAALLLAITIVLGWYLKDRFGSTDQRLDRLEKDIGEMKTLLAGQQVLLSGQQAQLTGLQGLLTASARTA